MLSSREALVFIFFVLLGSFSQISIESLVLIDGFSKALGRPFYLLGVHLGIIIRLAKLITN